MCTISLLLLSTLITLQCDTFIMEYDKVSGTLINCKKNDRLIDEMVYRYQQVDTIFLCASYNYPGDYYESASAGVAFDLYMKLSEQLKFTTVELCKTQSMYPGTFFSTKKLPPDKIIIEVKYE